MDPEGKLHSAMPSTALSLDDKIQRSETILASDLKNEVVMMDIEEGSYYGMEAPGSRIWELLATPQSVAELCQILGAEYDIGTEQCQIEVLAFLEELLTRKIVVAIED